MIVPDLNLVVYAHNSDAPLHSGARQWWEDLLNGDESVGIPWAVTCGFVRLMTHPRVLVNPMTVEQALERVDAWFETEVAVTVDPGRRHLSLLGENLRQARVGANLVTDAHLAAIAIELQAELHSNDSDFARFSGLKWRNPLEVS